MVGGAHKAGVGRNSAGTKEAMLQRLTSHPDTPASLDLAVTVEIARMEEGALVLRYAAEGDVSRLRIPDPVPYSSRQDDLWQTTCFEAFLSWGGAGYLEFNFAPSTGWAAYRFPAYREGREDLPLAPPHLDVDRTIDRLEVTVVLDTASILDLSATAIWRVNLSAVIEESSGIKSYWALAHPPGKPDFHDPGCLALELPPLA